MQTRADYITEYKILLPVYQAFHSGNWGFEHVLGCLDLSRCTYETEHAAKCARARQAAEQYDAYVAMEDYYG